MKTILIGCPVYKREWIIGEWLAAFEKQDYPLDKLGFIFELGDNDEETHNVMWEWHEKHPEVAVFDGVIRPEEKHEFHPDGQRIWSGQRYYTMVTLRNHLLDRATCLEYDMYFSLDSDILLENPNTLSFIAENIDFYNVISPMSYMTPFDTCYPSVMWWTTTPGGHAYRELSHMKWGQFFEVDIVMAAVAMSPDVYKSVRYVWHKQGEDLGFAAELARAGFSSFCASNLYAPHIMHKQMLADYKKVGFDYRAAMGASV